MKPEVELDKMFRYHILTKQTGFFSSKMRHEHHNFDLINLHIYSCLSHYIKPFDSGTGGEQYLSAAHLCSHLSNELDFEVKRAQGPSLGQ